MNNDIYDQREALYEAQQRAHLYDEERKYEKLLEKEKERNKPGYVVVLHESQVSAMAIAADRYNWIRSQGGSWETEASLSGLTPEEYDREVDKRMKEEGR